MILTVVFYIFVAFTAIQVFYYLAFSSFLFKNKKETKTNEQAPISVLIFAKNCAKDLQKNLPLILAQKYATFEVILINNASTDNTLEIIENFTVNNKNIKVLDVENNEAFWGNKKYALTLGIKAAKYEHLLFIDASAKPISEFWIAEMSKNFNNSKKIILGYSKYQKENSLTNILIRFEHLLTAIKCFSFTKLKSPFMAFGTNLSYQKSEFFRVKGFINHIKIKDGEDDLFIKDAAAKSNNTFTLSKDSFVEINSPKSFRTWFLEQRKNKILKKQYLFKHQFLLSFFTFSKVLFYALAITMFFFYSWQIIVPFILTYYLVQYIVIGISANKLKEPTIIFFLPFLEIALFLIQISIFSANLISKPNHWK